jgi:hypothetical protein
MSSPAATAVVVLPTQVWPALPADRKVRAIHLLAELALTLVTRPPPTITLLSRLALRTNRSGSPRRSTPSTARPSPLSAACARAARRTWSSAAPMGTPN